MIKISVISKLRSVPNILNELAVNRGWVNPYTSPEEQLTDVYVKSRMTVNEEK